MDPLTYLLVDFENLQPPAQDIALVRGAQYRLWVFHGPKQKKFSAEMVVAWQPLGNQVKFVQSSKEGKNALDFHIAFCLGQAQKEDAAAGRKARYVVVSGDGGFDPLFEYMRGLGCDVAKVLTIPAALGNAQAVLSSGLAANLPAPPPPSPKPVALPAAKKTAAKPAKTAVKQPVKKAASVLRSQMTPEDVTRVIADLKAHPGNRPSDRKALENHTVSVLQNKVTKQVVQAVIADLESKEIVSYDGKKIVYKLPKAKK